MPEPEYTDLVAEVNERFDIDPVFQERMRPISLLFGANLENPFPSIGAGALALHLDDLAAGRWPRA